MNRKTEKPKNQKTTAVDLSRFSVFPFFRFSVRGGITLIEVLVSVAMLGLAAVTVLQALARIAHAQALTSYQAHANLFAMAKLGGVEVAFREGQEITPREAGTFRVGPHAFQWELTSVAAKDAPPVRAVNLTVRWRAAQQNYSRTFETQLRLLTPKSTS